MTAGAAGLGSAVATKFLDEGWQVVVPWIVEAELERLATHPRRELIRADLFDPPDVAEVAQLAGKPPRRPSVPSPISWAGSQWEERCTRLRSRILTG